MSNKGEKYYNYLKTIPELLVCGASISLGYHSSDIPVEEALDNIDDSSEKMRKVYELLLKWIKEKKTCAVGLKKEKDNKIESFWRLYSDGTIVVTAPKRVHVVSIDLKDAYCVNESQNGIRLIPCGDQMNRFVIRILEYEQPWINYEKGTENTVLWRLQDLENIPFDMVRIGKNVDIMFMGIAAENYLHLPKNIKKFSVSSANENFSVKNDSLCAYDIEGKEYLIRVPDGMTQIEIPDVYAISTDAIHSFEGELVIPKSVKWLKDKSICLNESSSNKIVIKSSKIRAKKAFAIKEDAETKTTPYFSLDLPGLFDYKEADNGLISTYSGRCFYCGGKISKSKGCCSSCGKKELSIAQANKKYRVLLDTDDFRFSRRINRSEH